MPPSKTDRVSPGTVTSRSALILALLLAPAGCAKEKPAAPPPRATTVLVAHPIEREVSDFEDFVGQTMAVMTIDVRARVTGYLDKVFFEDGSEVNQDVVLFEIDPRPYQSEVNRTQAALAQAEAHNKRLDADFRRAQTLLARDQLARADYDLTAGDFSESTAMVGIAKANYDLALLNLGFTKVTAPIAGRLSRRLVDPGNLVGADTTILTSIVSLDPMYVYFDVDERTLLKIRRLINSGKIKSRTEAEIPIQGALADETDFPHRGVLNFSDNKLDTNTGTLRVRAVLPNPKPRVFSPGLFMKVRLPVGLPRAAMLIPEEAVGSDQGAKYVLIVDEKKTVVRRPIRAGNLYFQKWRAVEGGVGPNDQIIVSGLQRVRDGLKGVEVKLAQPEAPPASAGSGPSTWPTTPATSAPPPPPSPAATATAAPPASKPEARP